MMSSSDLNTRTKILQASLKLLEKSGGKGVRVSDIAKKAGISRQALYLHFPGRTELLIETTKYHDTLMGVDERLSKSRTANSGIERLDAFIDAWSKYIPEIYGIAKALMAMGESDDAARDAWAVRMRDMREGCEAAINALNNEKQLNPTYSAKIATDILWTLLSVENWEQLTIDCGWSQKQYVEIIKQIAKQQFVKT